MGGQMSSELNLARFGSTRIASGVIENHDEPEYLQAALLNAFALIRHLERRLERLEQKL